MTITTAQYLEDVKVGDSFTTHSHRLEEEEIKAFAAQYDPQPFHLDDEAAKGTLFGGLAASGWHTAAISMRLQVENGIPLVGGLIGAGGEISWPQPTRAGDELRVHTEVLDVKPSRSRPERGIITICSKTLNQRDEVLQILTAKMVAWSREAQQE